jgi:hypothetical protein
MLLLLRESNAEGKENTIGDAVRCRLDSSRCALSQVMALPRSDEIAMPGKGKNTPAHPSVR